MTPRMDFPDSHRERFTRPIFLISLTLAWSTLKWLEFPGPFESVFIVLLYLWSAYGLSSWAVWHLERSEAKKLGADVAPVIYGWPGLFGIDTILRMAFRIQNETPGSWINPKVEAVGGFADVRTGGRAHFFTYQLEAINHMLNHEDYRIYEKPPELQNAFEPILKSSIFTANFNGAWKSHRNLLRPIFAQDRIKSVDILQRHADALFEKLGSRSEGSSIDISSYLSRTLLDISTELIFGTGTDSLKAYDGIANKGGKGFLEHCVTVQTFAIQRLILTKTLFKVLYGFRDPDAESIKYLEDFTQRAIDKKLGERALGLGDPDTIADYLVSQEPDRNQVRDHLLSILLAAKDTLTSLTVSCLYCFAKNPSCFRRAREEVTGTLQGPPTPEDLKRLPYVKAVVDEALRLFPPIPENLRCPIKDDVIEIEGRRIMVPANATVNFSIWRLHRSPEIWGRDAEVFDPLRWLDGRTGSLPSGAFQPFLIGPRTCLGMTLAYTEAMYIVVRTLQAFSAIHLDRAAPEPLPIANLTLQWKNGLQVYLTSSVD